MVPASVLEQPGFLPVSVVGYGDDGAIRATTERCDHLIRVAESGEVEGGEAIPDAPDLLGQLVAAKDAAEDAAESADQAAARAEDAAESLAEGIAAANASAEEAASHAADAAGHASDAQASAKAAETSRGGALAAQKAAESASVSAQKAAQSASDASVSASQAASSAQAAAESAQASAESIELPLGTSAIADGAVTAAKLSDRACSMALASAKMTSNMRAVPSEYVTVNFSTFPFYVRASEMGSIAIVGANEFTITVPDMPEGRIEIATCATGLTVNRTSPDGDFAKVADTDGVYHFFGGYMDADGVVHVTMYTVGNSTFTMGEDFCFTMFFSGGGSRISGLIDWGDAEVSLPIGSECTLTDEGFRVVSRSDWGGDILIFRGIPAGRHMASLGGCARVALSIPEYDGQEPNSYYSDHVGVPMYLRYRDGVPFKSESAVHAVFVAPSGTAEAPVETLCAPCIT